MLEFYFNDQSTLLVEAAVVSFRNVELWNLGLYSDSFNLSSLFSLPKVGP